MGWPGVPGEGVPGGTGSSSHFPPLALAAQPKGTCSARGQAAPWLPCPLQPPHPLRVCPARHSQDMGAVQGGFRVPSIAKETPDLRRGAQTLPACPGSSTASPTHLASALLSASRSRLGRLPSHGKSSQSRPPAAETPGETQRASVVGLLPACVPQATPLVPTVLPTPPCHRLIRHRHKLNPVGSVITQGCRGEVPREMLDHRLPAPRGG